jgi:drug/metabolite transporter (DMT)-like permease
MPSISHPRATLAVFAAALAWGLWWVPIRLLDDAGLPGVWPALAMNGGAALLLLGVAIALRAPLRLPLPALAGAALIGVAVTLYGSSLAYTEVVRAVLLFYLAPAWSTAIECLFLGRRFSWKSIPALALSLAGMAAILGGEVSLSVEGVGDLMALASGMAWSAGSSLIFARPGTGTASLSAVAMTASFAVSLLLVLLGGAAAGAAPGPGTLLASLQTALGWGALYLAPIVLVTLWGASRLPPATLAFVLTAEIVSGVASAALFLDERFGWTEAIGALLITLGALLGMAAEAEQGIEAREP